MSERILSPGREEYPEEIQRPSGRSFLSVVQNTIEHSSLPPALQEPEAIQEGAVYSFAEWRKAHYKRVWDKERARKIVSIDSENGVL